MKKSLIKGRLCCHYSCHAFHSTALLFSFSSSKGWGRKGAWEFLSTSSVGLFSQLMLKHLLPRMNTPLCLSRSVNAPAVSCPCIQLSVLPIQHLRQAPASWAGSNGVVFLCVLWAAWPMLWTILPQGQCILLVLSERVCVILAFYHVYFTFHSHLLPSFWLFAFGQISVL